MLRKLKELVYMNRYPQLSASELEALREDTNEVMLLPSSNDYGWFTSFESGESYISNAEVITLGRARYANIKYCNGPFISSNNHIIETKDKNQLRTRYLYNFLSYTSKTYYVESTSYPKFEKDIFENTTLDVPEVSVQDARIKELDLLNNAIFGEKRRLSEFDSLIKSRFIEMFGDPIENSKNLKTTEVINVVKLQRGFDLPTSMRNRNGNIPLYGSNGIIDHHDEAKCNNGVITGRSGTLGEVYYSTVPFWPLNTTLFSVNTHGNSVVYLKWLLTFYHLERFGSGSGVPTLNRNTFHHQQIIDVSKKEQVKFESFVEKVDKLKFNCQQRIKLYQELLNKKMDEYFG